MSRRARPAIVLGAHAMRRIAAGCGALVVAGGLGWRLVHPPVQSHVIAPGLVQAVGGHQYYAALDGTPLARLSPDVNEAPRRSVLELWAGDLRLGPAHAQHATIHDEGKGAYSHWGNGVHFSLPDNGDPRVASTPLTARAVVTPSPAARRAMLAGIAVAAWLALTCFGFDMTSAAKLAAVGWAVLLTFHADFSTGLQRFADLRLSGQSAAAAGYAAVAMLAAIGLALAPFVRGGGRAGLSLALLSGLVVDQVLQGISGQPLRIDLIPVLISERDMASTVLPAYLPTAAPVLAGGLLLLAIFLLPPRRVTVPSRLAVVPAVGAWLGAVLLAAAPPGRAVPLPPTVGVPAMVAASLLPHDTVATTREPVAYARAFTPRVRKLVVVIDESVRGDVMGINDPRYGNTPFLASLGDALVNFGVATSATNCSVATRVILRMGLQPPQLPDVGGAATRRQPTVWQYAKAAGYRTSLLDAWARLHSYMDEAEFAQIEDFAFVDGDEHARDERLPPLIADRLRGEERRLIYVNKLGIHPKYGLKVPPGVTDTPAFPPPPVPLDDRRLADVADYHRALRHSVDDFFRDLWPRLDEDTAVIYTSDHGQSLYEGGYDMSHCSLTPDAHRGELRVPLFVLTRNVPLRDAFRAAATRLHDQADHYALHSTILQLLGYAPDWADATYGPSLWTAQPHARRFLLGTYNDPGAYWVPY